MTVSIEVISPVGLVLAKIEFLQKDDGWISVVLTCGGTRASFLWLEADGLLDSRARYLNRSHPGQGIRPEWGLHRRGGYRRYKARLVG